MVTVKLNLEDGSNQEMTALSKTFKSGKTGYFGQAKVVTDDGERYQAQIQLVKIEK